jgi:hypothetical protein
MLSCLDNKITFKQSLGKIPVKLTEDIISLPRQCRISPRFA